MRASFADISSVDSARLPKTGTPQWDREGVLLLEGIIPPRLIDAYVEQRRQLIGKTSLWEPGWPDPIPYLRVATMKELALHRPLTQAMRPLIGADEPGLHLCLTGFKSTERAWHQDRYLNPESVGERYLAAWIVLDDVDPEAGPFEYVPGSHEWPVIERSKVWARMRELGQNPDAPTWPSDSQEWVSAACAEEMDRRHARPKAFLGKRGDVLLWHASLLHRGSIPKNRAIERRALICHYSAVGARPDMPIPTRADNGSHYFDFGAPAPSPMASPPPESHATRPVPGLRTQLKEFWRRVREEAKPDPPGGERERAP